MLLELVLSGLLTFDTPLPDGGLEVDTEQVSVTNLYPGNPGAEYVTLSNTAAVPLYVQASSTRSSGQLQGIEVTFDACNRTWRSKNCGDKADVLRFVLDDATDDQQSVYFVIDPGHVSYLQIAANVPRNSEVKGQQRATIDFLWTGQKEKPTNQTIHVLPTSRIAGWADTTVHQNELASTGAPLGIAALVAAGITVWGGALYRTAKKGQR